MSRLADAAQAVRDLLAGKAFALPSGATLSVERTYTPPVAIEDGDTNVHMYVWPSAREAQRHTRNTYEDLITVSVGVVRRLPVRGGEPERDAVDEVLLIVDQVVGYLAFNAAGGIGPPLQVTQSPPLAQSRLEEQGLCVCVVAAQYREEFVAP